MTESAKASARPAPYTPGAARTPPKTSALDLARLVGALAGDAVRQRGDFRPRATFRAWAAGAAARHGSPDLVLDLGVKRVLLVGSRDLSAEILTAPPSPDGLAAGAMKRDAMAFLAPGALTIADGDDWVRLRALNERVLDTGRPHAHADAFIARVREAFAGPVASPDDLRAAMGRAMLGIVFGPGSAPASLADDVTTLVGYVQSPLKRKLLAPLARRKRARFYADLRRACAAAEASVEPSLVALAREHGARVGETELVEQVPHWMFTFPGSGTDLLARTLALVCAHPEARSRALNELRDAGLPVTDAATVGALAYLHACVREAAALYPPVTRTFHRAPQGATAAGVTIPAGMDVLHSFPPIADGVGAAAPRRFRPERWLAADAPAPSFDPFLGGARACPGRDLITLVCVAALAHLLGERRLTLDGTPLPPAALPEEFPRRGLHFHAT
jgi:cytochrome P450